MLDEWITSVKNELGIELDVDTDVLLDLARDAAHGVARPAAPLATCRLVAVRGGRPGERRRRAGGSGGGGRRGRDGADRLADRAGYNDNADGEVDLLDAVLRHGSTTGYGDITPYSAGARLINVVLVTPRCGS
ncbi:hypothetical protein SMICM304S_06678 [Streptomyces microflavus]